MKPIQNFLERAIVLSRVTPPSTSYSAGVSRPKESINLVLQAIAEMPMVRRYTYACALRRRRWSTAREESNRAGREGMQGDCRSSDSIRYV